MHATILVLLLTTTWSISAFRATRSNLGTRIIKKQAECQSIVGVSGKTTLDEGGDKFPSATDEAYFKCRKVLDDLKRMYISEHYPGLVAYPSKFPVQLPSGISIMLPSPPEVTFSKDPPGSPKYIPVEGICMVYEKCKMFLKNNLSEESYYREKYVHCVNLLNELKAKYVREIGVDLGKPHSEEEITIKCNGEVVSLLPKSSSESLTSFNSRPDLTSKQESATPIIEQTNNIHTVPDYLKDRSSVSTSDKLVIPINSESSSNDNQPPTFSLKRFYGTPSSAIRSKQTEEEITNDALQEPVSDKENTRGLSQNNEPDRNSVQGEDSLPEPTVVPPSPLEEEESEAPPVSSGYDRVNDICMIHEKCKMILADINENEDVSEQSYFREKYLHCLMLLNDLKQKYINDIKIENSPGNKETSIECNGGKVSLLPESLSDNESSLSSGRELSTQQKYSPVKVKTINDIHSRSKLGENISAKKVNFYDDDSSTSETNQPAQFSFKRLNDIHTPGDSEQANRRPPNPEVNLTVRESKKSIESSQGEESENARVESGSHEDNQANVDQAVVSTSQVGRDEVNTISNPSNDYNSADGAEINKQDGDDHAASPTTVSKNKLGESSSSSDQDRTIDTSVDQGTSHVVENISPDEKHDLNEAGEDDVETESNAGEENKLPVKSNVQDGSADSESSSLVHNHDITEVDKGDIDHESNAKDYSKDSDQSKFQGDAGESASSFGNHEIIEMDKDSVGQENNADEERKQPITSNNQDDSAGGESTSQIDNQDINEVEKEDIETVDRMNSAEENSNRSDISHLLDDIADSEPTSLVDSHDVAEMENDDGDQEKSRGKDSKQSDISDTQSDSDDGESGSHVAGDDLSTSPTKGERKEPAADHKETDTIKNVKDYKRNNQQVKEVVYDMSVLGPQGSSISASFDVVANNKDQRAEPNVEKVNIRVMSEPATTKPPTPRTANSTPPKRISLSSRTLGDEIMALEEDCRELLNMANKAPDSLADIDGRHAECENSLDDLKHQYIADRHLDVARYRDVFPITLSTGAKKFVVLPRPQGSSSDVLLLRHGPGRLYERDDLFDDSVDWETVGSRRNKVMIDNPAFISNEKFLEYFNQGPSNEASTLTKFANMLHMNLGRSEENPPANL